MFFLNMAGNWYNSIFFDSLGVGLLFGGVAVGIGGCVYMSDRDYVEIEKFKKGYQIQEDTVTLSSSPGFCKESDKV